MKAAVQTLRRAAPWVLLAAVVAYSTVLRVRLLTAGPDADADAYDHFHIGMRLVGERAGLTVHWVWLPLWHLVDAAVYALGGGIGHVRLLSVLCTAASSFALAALLRGHLAARRAPWPWLAEAERAIPFVAGAAFALWPLNLRGGASAEPEAMFQLLLLGAALGWQSRRFALTGAALSLAALLRYESWPVAAAFGALWLAEERSRRAALAWAMPAVTALGWCVAHRVAAGSWLRFFADNRAYVEDAWRAFDLAGRGLERVAHPYTWYALRVPAQALRGWAWWLLPGLPWVVWRGPRGLTVPSLALLATVTAVWVTRRNLGLDRHFAGLVAVYAAMAAAGLVGAVSLVAARLDRRVARAMLALALVVTLDRFATWRVRAAERSYRRHQAAFAPAWEAAAVLRREAAADATVFTQSRPLMALAGLPFARYVGWRAADLRDFNLLVESAHHGEAWVAASPGEVSGLRDGVEIRYRGDGLVLLRRRAPRAVDPALRGLPACR